MCLGRLWLLIVLSVLSTGAIAQRVDLPEGYPRDGETKSNDFGLGIGSGVDTTYTYVREDDTVVPLFSCVRECEGKKHTKHDECDLSCDKACPARQPFGPAHHAVFSGRVTELAANGGDPPPRPHAEQLNRDYGRFQFPSTWQASTFLLRLTNMLTRTQNYLETIFLADHWNETPCSTSTKSIKAVTYTVTVQYTLFDKVGQVITEGPKGTIRYRVLIPVRDPVSVGQPEVNCKCEATQTGPEDGHGFLPGTTGEHYAYVEEGGKKRPMTGGDVSSLVTNVSVTDMNNATLSYMTSRAGNVFIPAGWEFECTEGGGQDVQLADDLYFAAEAGGGTIHLSLAPATSARQSKKIRVYCTEIDKPEPRPDMKYRLVPPRNALLQRAAQITKASSFRGPWDQMRLWIATDQATFKSIEDKLLPSPGPATYVAEMHKLAQVGAIDTYDSRYLALMELSHLLAPFYEARAVAWMLGVKLTAEQEKTVAWFAGQRQAIASAFDRADPKATANLVGLIASVLAREGGDAGVGAALWILDVAVPEQHRSAVADAAAASVASALERTESETVATSVLDWVSRTKRVGSTPGLLSANLALPEAVRNRAAALAAEIWPGKGR